MDGFLMELEKDDNVERLLENQVTIAETTMTTHHVPLRRWSVSLPTLEDNHINEEDDENNNNNVENEQPQLLNKKRKNNKTKPLKKNNTNNKSVEDIVISPVAKRVNKTISPLSKQLIQKVEEQY